MENGNDLISRQAAIDAIEKMNIPEDMCVFEILSHIEVEIATLPSAQPEIIRCKDCKNYYPIEKLCGINGEPWKEEDFCSYAERREDG